MARKKPDDRDHLAYQTVLGPEDLFAERISRDSGRRRAQLLWKVSHEGNLAKMPSGALTPQIMEVLTQSGLGSTLSEINPSEILDSHSKLTRMGEGGIPSIDSIPDEARAVHPSQFGFVDGVRTPESLRVGVDTYLASGSRKGEDGRIYSKFRDNRTGQEVWKSPHDLTNASVTSHDVMSWNTKRVPVMKNSELTYVPKNQVDYVLPHFEHAFSHLGNMVPLKSTVKPQRMAMASRMMTQALPLVGAEAPLVRTGTPEGDTSYEEGYGAPHGRHQG